MMQMVTYIRQRWWLQCVLMWFITFLVLNIVGLVGAQNFLLDESEVSANADLVSLHNFPGIWKRWDAGYYLDIATDGYIKHPRAAGFFPLYPMLIGIIHRITEIDVISIGLLVSNISFLFSVLLFYKIARLIEDNHTFAIRSVLAMLVFPTSFFYFALYAESLYLLLALLAIYLILQKQQSVSSGIALGLSSIARPVGWLVDIIMLGEFIRRRKFDVKAIVSLGLGLLLSIVGVILYIYYLYTVLGTFMAIPDAQSYWPRQWQYPWITYWEGIKTLGNPSLIKENWFLYAMNALDLAFTSFAVFIILISFSWARKNEFPWSLSVYSFVSLAFFLSSQNELPVPLWGMSRWVASLFPIYLIIGNMFGNGRIQKLYYFGSTLFLIFFTAWWTSGRWIG